MMYLRIYNKTNAAISYLNGSVVVPANAFLDVPAQYWGSLCVDVSLRHDLTSNNVDVSDTLTRYGNNDGIKQLDYMVGLRDSEGNSLTSTTITTQTAVHQGLDVNIISGASNGAPDKSAFIYGDTAFVSIGGVFNDGADTLTQGQQAAVRITENRALHTTLVDSSIDINPVPASTSKTKFQYNEATNVPVGATTVVCTYTVPVNTQAVLQKVMCSGGNIGQFYVSYNSGTIATKRTYFTEYNTDFNFLGSSNNGLIMQAGDTLQVSVLQSGDAPSTFESTIQIIEVS